MSDWYKGPATIVQGSTAVSVECSIWSKQDVLETGAAGPVSWGGEWWAPNPPYALAAGPALLRLADVGEGQVTVSDVSTGLHGEQGTLTGTGDLPA